MSGRLEGRVYRDLGGEGFVSAAPTVVNPRTQAQMDARARLSLAVRLWRELPPDAMGRGREGAEANAGFSPTTGRRRSGRGDLVFRGLAAKYLQIHGGVRAPTEPPPSPFYGEGIVVTATGGASGVRFAASSPNSPGGLTELLVQPLAAAYRKPHPEEYRTRAFVAFADGALEAEVPLSPGAYACAIRFVRGTTGQAGPLVPLGVVVAG